MNSPYLQPNTSPWKASRCWPALGGEPTLPWPSWTRSAVCGPMRRKRSAIACKEFCRPPGQASARLRTHILANPYQGMLGHPLMLWKLWRVSGRYSASYELWTGGNLRTTQRYEASSFPSSTEPAAVRSADGYSGWRGRPHQFPYCIGTRAPSMPRAYIQRQLSIAGQTVTVDEQPVPFGAYVKSALSQVIGPRFIKPEFEAATSKHQKSTGPTAAKGCCRDARTLHRPIC
jgi:hypothetical protein